MQSSASAAVQSRSGESSGRSIHRPDRRTFSPADAKRPGREGEELDAAGESGADAAMEPASRREAQRSSSWGARSKPTCRNGALPGQVGFDLAPHEDER